MSFTIWALIIGAILITMALLGTLLKRLPMSPGIIYLAIGYARPGGMGTHAEIAVVGNEGILGISLFMGGNTTPSHAIVQSAGHAYRLKADLLKNEFKRYGPTMHLLLRYTQALITQMAQTAACNRHHSVDQQLCRWLLLCLDRLAANEISTTQELIANMLGVRREGVTEATGKLQDAGLIHYNRGRIAVLDRPGLEARCCECYQVVKREFDRLLPYVAK